jgi:hypothetical protein
MPPDLGELDPPFLDQPAHEPLPRAQQLGSLVHPEHPFLVHPPRPLTPLDR